MQDKKDLTKPTSSRGAGVGRCVGSLRKVGKENRGRQRLVRSDALIKTKGKIMILYNKS